jgi:hypothetical protein
MSTTASPPTNSAVAHTGIGKSRTALVVSFLLLLNFVYFLFSSGRVRTIDEVSAAFQVESLAKHRTTAIPQAVEANEFWGTFDRFGRAQSGYPPGQAFALLPWYVVGQSAGRHLPGVPAASRDAFSDFFLTGESAFFSALAAALSLYIFLELGIAPKISLFAAGILAFATPLAVYSGWLYSEPLAAALLLAAAAVLFSTPQTAHISILRGLSTGALLGAAIWVRPTHVIAVPVFLAAMLVRERKKGWGPAIALAAVAGTAVALLLWRNSYLHGNLLDFGYPSAAEGGKDLITFQTPLETGLLGFLVSPGKSIFLFSPPILLAMLGLPRAWRRDRGLAVVAAAAPLVYLLFFATYTQWEGGYCYGPRYLIPALALLGLGIGPALEAASRRVRLLAVAVFAGGFLVQAAGSAVSFLEADVAGGYYDAQYNYRMSFSPIAMHIHLLVHYAVSGAAPIGRGFDKWWVFLSKAGVSMTALLALASGLLLSAVVSVWWLRRGFERANSEVALD